MAETGAQNFQGSEWYSPQLEHESQSVVQCCHHILPTVRLPGEQQSTTGPEPVEEGGRREGPATANGLYSHSVYERKQVPFCRESGGAPHPGWTVLRTQQHLPQLVNPHLLVLSKCQELRQKAGPCFYLDNTSYITVTCYRLIS